MANDNRPSFLELQYRIMALLFRVLLHMPYRFWKNVSQSRRNAMNGGNGQLAHE